MLRKFRRLESSCANSVQLEDRSFLELSICDEKILRLESHVLLFEHKAYSLEKLLQDLEEKKTVLKSEVLEMEDRTSDENVGSTAQQTQCVDENVHQGFMKTQKIVSEAFYKARKCLLKVRSRKDSMILLAIRPERIRRYSRCQPKEGD